MLLLLQVVSEDGLCNAKILILHMVRQVMAGHITEGRHDLACKQLLFVFIAMFP
jgi:hypothetical protein